MVQGLRPGDALLVKVSAIGTAQVLDHESIISPMDNGMVP
jgi:hypothetical protein